MWSVTKAHTSAAQGGVIGIPHTPSLRLPPSRDRHELFKRVSNLEDRDNNRLVRERTAFYSVKRRAASLIENGREWGAARVQNALPAATPLMSTTVNE